jgi:hypothetical protein
MRRNPCTAAGKLTTTALATMSIRQTARPVGNELGGIQHAAAEDYFRNVRVCPNALRRVFVQQQQIGALADLNGTDLTIQLECLGIGSNDNR